MRKFRVPATSGISGREDLETLFPRVKNNVLRSSAFVRAYISRFICCSREREGELLLDDFFRAPAISCFRRPKKDPARTVVFRSQCFAMFSQHRRRHSPALFLSFNSLPILLSSYDSSSLDHIFAMFHPSDLDHHRHSFLLLFFFPFPTTSAETLVPFPLAMTIPHRLLHSFNPVNQNSMRKRGQMYTTRGARRTGCPERSPTAIDFRRLE